MDVYYRPHHRVMKIIKDLLLIRLLYIHHVIRLHHL